MRILQLLKIPYAALPLLPKIQHLHNLLSIILLHMVILQSLLLTLPVLFKIYQLNILLHMFIL
jgi:hypothetical protein